MTRAGDELIIHIGNQKRTLLLPRALLPLEVKSAQYADNFLSIVVRQRPRTRRRQGKR